MMLMDAVLRLVQVYWAIYSLPNKTRFQTAFRLSSLHQTVEFQGMMVPEVLRSGNHGLIAEWRLKQSLRRTLERRPDLLEKRSLIPKESCL